MILIILSFLAGILTVLAPCVFPLLPIIIGGSSTRSSRFSPWIITGSLLLSIIVFTLLLRATTALLFIDQAVWNWISGSIIILIGLTILFPDAWNWIATALNLQKRSDNLLEKGKREGAIGDIITGLALGPVFTSCSPTYGYILGTVPPAGWLFGILNLVAYCLGLGLVLLLVSLFGQRITRRLQWISNPYSIYKQVIGGVFILVGIAIIAGWLKLLEAWSAELLADSIIRWEVNLLRNIS